MKSKVIKFLIAFIFVVGGIAAIPFTFYNMYSAPDVEQLHGGFRWGDTKSDLLYIYDIIYCEVDDNNRKINYCRPFEDSFLGEPVVSLFELYEGKLESITVMYEGTKSVGESYNVAARFITFFTKAYGKPVYVDRSDTRDTFGWVVNDTLILVAVDQSVFGVDIYILYVSTPALNRVQEEVPNFNDYKNYDPKKGSIPI